MKNILSVVAAMMLLAHGAAAANNCASVAVTAIPSCAQSCFLEGASFVGCDSLDFSCQCGKEAALYAAIEPCVATGCPAASIQAVINGASSGRRADYLWILRLRHLGLCNWIITSYGLSDALGACWRVSLGLSHAR
ncbi:MAC1 interacting protein 1 [Colletotrichum tabaci]|uniref:MAC1 interacting protein 1 n=1 Tax=Colletotrichum tabaci TaxID=1209068 RepID=A0AAV9T1E1_9PEZI